MVSLAAILVGVFFVVQGIAGIAGPEGFVRLLRVIQTPPVLYVAAVVRFAFGVVLLYAAAGSRMPVLLRALGILIVIASALAPFFGARFGHALLDWWSAGGPPRVRAWAGVSLALGLLVVYAALPSRGPNAT